MLKSTAVWQYCRGQQPYTYNEWRMETCEIVKGVLEHIYLAVQGFAHGIDHVPINDTLAETRFVHSLCFAQTRSTVSFLAIQHLQHVSP